MLNGNKVVVGGGEVCDACVVAALSGGTEEIAKFWYGKLETWPEIASMGIYLKTSGPGFFDADFCMGKWGRTGQQAARPWCCVERKESGRMHVCRSSPTVVCGREQGVYPGKYCDRIDTSRTTQSYTSTLQPQRTGTGGRAYKWLIEEATPTEATRKARRAVEREQLCARPSRQRLCARPSRP